MKRSAVEIALAYKFRWQIELLFRWLKQHLKLRAFLGTSPNAVKLQIYAAMIAFILLRLAAKAAKTKLDILRFTQLVGAFLFHRRSMTAIEKAAPGPSQQKTGPVQSQSTGLLLCVNLPRTAVREAGEGDHAQCGGGGARLVR